MVRVTIHRIIRENTTLVIQLRIIHNTNTRVRVIQVLFIVAIVHNSQVMSQVYILLIQSFQAVEVLEARIFTQTLGASRMLGQIVTEQAVIVT